MLRAADEISSFLRHAGAGETPLRFATGLDTTKWVVRQRLRRVVDGAAR